MAISVSAVRPDVFWIGKTADILPAGPVRDPATGPWAALCARAIAASAVGLGDRSALMSVRGRHYLRNACRRASSWGDSRFEEPWRALAAGYGPPRHQL